MFMQQMAPDIFVRILREWRLAEKNPHSLSDTLSWMTPSETLLRLCLGGFGKIFFGNVFFWLLSDFTVS